MFCQKVYSGTDGHLRIDNTTYHAKSFGNRVKFLILHYTAGNFEASVRTLTQGSVSSHYLVSDVHPSICYQLVDESRAAWHAGVSRWRNYTALNAVSIGVEIVNLGFQTVESKWQPYSNEQIDAVIQLTRRIVDTYEISPTFVLGHSDVAIPAGRKIDPGPLFPWKRLYQNGVGAWYDEKLVETLAGKIRRQRKAINATEVQTELRKYGYGVAVTGLWDLQTEKTVTVFQMHFRPSNYSGKVDEETMAILEALNSKYST